MSTATGDVADGYEDKVFILDDETPEGLAALIERVCSMQKAERQAVGAKARQYVLSEKTWAAQSGKIFEFIAYICGKKQ